MAEPGDDLRFPREPFAELLARDLDRYRAIEAGVPGAVDLAHASFADEVEDFVRADPLPGPS